MIARWIRSDLTWWIFGIVWLVAGIVVTRVPQHIMFQPLILVGMYASGAVLAYGVGYILKKTYVLTQEPTKFFFGLGLQYLGMFWVVTAALSPATMSEQTGMFLWAPHVGLFFAAILFLSGTISRSKSQREHLFKNHTEVDQIMSGAVVGLTIFLVTSPWGVRGIRVYEEGSLATGELVLEALLFILIILAFVLEYYHSSFKGFSYNTLARGLVFMTVAHYGLLVTQPWSSEWWLFQLAAYSTLTILLIKLGNEFETQSNIIESVGAWKPALASPQSSMEPQRVVKNPKRILTKDFE